MNVLTRWETKYELDSLSAQRLRHIVGRFLPLYEYLEGQPVTHVTTVYFDTQRLDFYKLASASEEYSVKMRLREYSYKLEGGPVAYLIDKNGVVRSCPSRKDMEEWIERLLAE